MNVASTIVHEAFIHIRTGKTIPGKTRIALATARARLVHARGIDAASAVVREAFVDVGANDAAARIARIANALAAHA